MSKSPRPIHYEQSHNKYKAKIKTQTKSASIKTELSE
jgi:hypothetical protein